MQRDHDYHRTAVPIQSANFLKRMWYVAQHRGYVVKTTDGMWLAGIATLKLACLGNSNSQVPFTTRIFVYQGDTKKKRMPFRNLPRVQIVG